MVGQIIDLRLRQLARIFREIGPVYIVLLLLVCTGFFLGLIDSLLKSTSPWMGLLGVFIIASVHFSRQDTTFLKKLNLYRPFLYLPEYFLLTLPFVMIYLSGGNLQAILVQSLGILLVSFLPNPELNGQSFSNTLDFKWLPLALFEARSYLRRFGALLLVVYLVGLFFTQYETVVMLMVVLTAMVFTAFFDEVEDKAILEAFHFRKGILKTKIEAYLGLYLILLLPYSILFLIQHSQYWYILLVGVFVGMTLILFNIFYKYAHYAPHRRRINNAMANSIFFVAVIIPFFYPVTLLYLFYYYRKARKNIQLYYAKN